MISGSLRGQVGKLRGLAASLRVNGDTGEQKLLLAIIDTLDELAGVMDDRLNADSGQTYTLNSQCPNCGKEISLSVSNLRGDEPVICDSCHEIIGVISERL